MSLSAVLAVAGAVYFFCLSEHLTQDSVAYIRSAVTGEELLHPHHVLYNPLMRCVAVLLDGARVETIVAALQYANIFITLATVMVVWFVVRSIGAPAWAAALYAMVFALSGGILEYSSQVEVYTVTTLFLAAAVLGAVLGRSSPWGAALAAAGWFGAMLFHQSAIFFGVFLAAHEFLEAGMHRLRRCAFIIALPLAAVGAVYLAVCRLQHCSTAVECWQWMTSYAHMGFWGKGTISCDTFRQGGTGMLDALGAAWGMYSALLIALFVAVALVRDRRHARENRHLIAASLIWCAVQGGFSLWWFAPNAEFWIFALLPLTVCIAAVAHSRVPCARHVLMDRAVSMPIICVIILSMFSAFDQYHRARSPNQIRRYVAQCVDEVRPRDTVVAADNEMRQYSLLYLNTAHVLSFNGQIARTATRASGSGTFTQKLLDVLAAELCAAQGRGGRVFVDRRVIRGSVRRIRLMRDFDPEVFTRDILHQFNVVPLDIGVPRWYELRPASGGAAASAAVSEQRD